MLDDEEVKAHEEALKKEEEEKAAQEKAQAEREEYLDNIRRQTEVLVRLEEHFINNREA